MTPRQKAAACFALARSTEHEAERDAAIGRGTIICERAGLSLDDFDIPGRKNADPESWFRRVAKNPYAERGAVAEAMRRFRQSMREAEIAAGARVGETAYDARRRNFDDALEEARKRDAARDRRDELRRVVNELTKMGFHIYPFEQGSWFVYYRERSTEATDQELLDLFAEIVARRPAEARA